MTEQDYEKAAENFGRALSLLASKIGTLSKPPLKVPPINAGSDDAEKRKALRDMLESLASTDDAAVLSQEDIRRASNFFAKLYGGSEPYRHRYADICDLVFNALGQSSGDLDEGVPYSVNCLAENIRIIHEYLTKHGLCDQAKSVLKLADHIDLEKTRLSHDIEQQQAMRAFNAAIAEVKAERDEADQKRAELEREFDERLDKTRMEYIAILVLSRRLCSPSTAASGSRLPRWARSALTAAYAPSCSSPRSWASCSSTRCASSSCSSGRCPSTTGMSSWENGRGTA